MKLSSVSFPYDREAFSRNLRLHELVSLLIKVQLAVTAADAEIEPTARILNTKRPKGLAEVFNDNSRKSVYFLTQSFTYKKQLCVSELLNAIFLIQDRTKAFPVPLSICTFTTEISKGDINPFKGSFLLYKGV